MRRELALALTAHAERPAAKLAEEISIKLESILMTPTDSDSPRPVGGVDNEASGGGRRRWRLVAISSWGLLVVLTLGFEPTMLDWSMPGSAVPVFLNDLKDPKALMLVPGTLMIAAARSRLRSISGGRNVAFGETVRASIVPATAMAVSARAWSGFRFVGSDEFWQEGVEFGVFLSIVVLVAGWLWFLGWLWPTDTAQRSGDAAPG